MPGLLQSDPERHLQGIVETRIAGEVLQVTHHDPIAIGEGDRRFGLQQIPQRKYQQRERQRRFHGQHHRPPPDRCLAMRLAGPGRRFQRRDPRLADLENRHRFGNALEQVSPMRAPGDRACLVKFVDGTMGDAVGDAGQQDLSRQRQAHETGSERLDQTLDFQRLGALGDIFRRVLPDHDIADMDAGTCRQLDSLAFGEFLECALVSECEGHGLDRPLEHGQKTVGLVDLQPVVLANQIAHPPVVPADDLCRLMIAQAFDQCRRFGQIADHERAQQRLRGVGHGGSRSFRRIHGGLLLLPLPFPTRRFRQYRHKVRTGYTAATRRANACNLQKECAAAVLSQQRKRSGDQNAPVVAAGRLGVVQSNIGMGVPAGPAVAVAQCPANAHGDGLATCQTQ